MSFPVAAALPKLPDDPAISRGVLPDGLSYMLVENPAVRGTADIALLQRACQTVEDVPAAFLARKCVSPDRKGFVQRKEDNVIYRFENFPVAAGDSYVDSLLLAVMRIAQRTAAGGSPAYGTTNQTVIIAGDIDRKAVAYKLKMLSLFVPKGVSEEPSDSYEWQAGDRLSVSSSEGDGPSRICFEFALPAMPRQNNNTVASVIADQFSEIFGTLLTASVRRFFRVNSVSGGTVAFTRERTDCRTGDFICRLDLALPQKDAGDAVRSIASILEKMLGGKVAREEYAWAYDKFIFDRKVLAERVLTNAEYVDRCLNAVIYNAGLSSDAEKFRLFAGKDVSDSLRLKHFNMFAMSFAGENSRVRISVDGAPAGMDADSLRRLVDIGRTQECRLVVVNPMDTLGFVSPLEKKGKKPSVKKDVITGGQHMKYSNGISVIYKQMKTGGVSYCSWMLPGGAETRIDLRKDDVGGLSGDAFMNLLESNGISLEVVTSSKDVRIEGCFDSRRLMLFLKAMQAVFASHPEFGNPAAGTLMLVGDRTPYSVEKILQLMMETFDTSGPGRKGVNVDDVWNSGDDDGSVLYRRLCLPDFFCSSENMMTAQVTVDVVRYALAEALAEKGCCAEVRGGFLTAPRDRFALDIKVCRMDGTDCRISDSEAASIVKQTLSALASKPYSKEKVDVARTLLRSRTGKEQERPEYWLDAARMRFTESKDVVTKYSEKLGTVTPESVMELARIIASSSPDEYYSSIR